jgi:hypothetical protein
MTVITFILYEENKQIKTATKCYKRLERTDSKAKNSF